MRTAILKEMQLLCTKIAAFHVAGIPSETNDMVRRLNMLARQAGFPTIAEVQAA